MYSDKGGSGAPIYTYNLLRYMTDVENKGKQHGIVFSTNDHYQNTENAFYYSVPVNFQHPPIFDSQPQMQDSIAFKDMSSQQIQKYQERMYTAIKNEVLNRQYDLIHVQHGMYIGYESWRIKEELKVPYAITLHIMELNFLDEFQDPLLAMKGMAEADRIIALTNAQKNRLLNEYSPENIIRLHAKQKHISLKSAKADYFDLMGSKTINPNNIDICHLGIDTNHFRIMGIDQLEQIHKELKIPYSNKIVLFIGRVIKMKGILDLLEAEQYYNSNNDIHTVIIGGGDLQDKIKEIAKQQKLIHYLGFKEQAIIPYYMNYAAAHNGILCVPSQSEGMSLVYIESMACGLPVVACAKYDMGELDFMQQPYARFANFGDAKNIAFNINKLLTGGVFGEVIQQKVLKYNPDMMGQLVYQVYSKILSKSSINPN